jgi:drug/metabolite transporter (DMT)-like permease
MSINWYLLGLMLLYGFFNGVGSLFYKLGLRKIKDDNVNLLDWNKTNVKAFLKIITTPIWMLGAIFLAIDFYIYQIALQKFELSVVKPLVNLNLIFVIFSGVFILKEKVRLKEWIGLVFVISGAFLITMYSTESETVVNYENLWIFLIFIGCIIILCMLIVRKKNLKRFEFFTSVTCGILFGLGGVFNKTFYASNLRPGFFTFFLILFLVAYCTAYFYGQAAYLKGRISVISPIVNIFSILIPFFGGIIIFDEFLFISSASVIVRSLKIVGFIFIIIGIMLNYTVAGKQEKVEKCEEIEEIEENVKK